jgi:uncharacterized membrane protein
MAIPFAIGMEAADAAQRVRMVIDISAAGYGPDWTFRLDHEGRLTFSSERARALVLMAAPAAGGIGGAGGLVYGAQSEAHQLVAEIAAASCTDGKSGEHLTHRVTIRFQGEEYRGCGTLIEVPLR